MRAGDDDRPDPRLAEAGQLGGDALDGSFGLRVGVEEIAGDEEQVDPLLDREIDSRELALTLGCRGFSEVGVTSAEVDVRGVEHRSIRLLLASCPSSRAKRRGELAPAPAPVRGALSGPELARARRPRPSLATPVLAGHCDRSRVTVASRRGVASALWPFRQIPVE